MGDLQVSSLPHQNGVVSREGHLCPLPVISKLYPSSSSSSNPIPSSIAKENWERAEKATREIVGRIHPTKVADEKRREVIEYVQGLIRDYVGYEIFLYGSVPLKTYLPDGDIDLTALSSPIVEEALVFDVHAVLKREEQRDNARFEVRDVQRIDAEVKLVKCLVQNIVVDISFNQLGGLCTLCFLEQVDQLVGKNHLFKRSIILIKAWCYYESRILGAHHGLISTYALEILVLYIFHLFHYSLDAPLAVLYRFLDYFSKFDWESYCISLGGPVCKSSLPNIVAEIPENGGNNLLLTKDFIEKCFQMFSVPSRGPEARAFPPKHLNIIDPLKENNNLGRSVNRGNYYRIRSAFKYGARKLGQILMLPREKIAEELNKFFANTLERHEENNWTSLPDPTIGFGAEYTVHSPSSSLYSDGLSDVKIPKVQAVPSLRNESETYSSIVVSQQAMPESCRCADGNERCDCLSPSNVDDALLQRKPFHSPRLRQNEKLQNVKSCKKNQANSVADDIVCTSSSYEHVGHNDDTISTPRERQFAGSPESLDSSNSLLDLSGNYESHLLSLLYGQYCSWFSVSSHVPHHTVVHGPQYYPVSPSTPSGYAYYLGEKKKLRGTGPFIPNRDHFSNGDRRSSPRGRFKAPVAQYERPHRNNGSSTAPRETPSLGESSAEVAKEEYPALVPGKFASSDRYQAHSVVWGSSNANSSYRTSQRREPETGDVQLKETRFPERSRQTGPDTPCSEAEISKAVPENNQESDAEAYRLMNVADFPPLAAP